MAGAYGFDEVVVGDLGEEVVHHVRADVMVDVVKHAVVAVDGGQTPPHVIPLLPHQKRGDRSLEGVNIHAW